MGMQISCLLEDNRPGINRFPHNEVFATHTLADLFVADVVIVSAAACG
jgi:hypothetical protein